MGHEDAVGRSVVRAEQDEADDDERRPEPGRQQQPEVERDEREVSGEEHAHAPEAIGEPAGRYGERHVGGRRADEEQRHEHRVEVDAALHREVDERVADRDEREQRADDEQPPERRHADEPGRRSQRDRRDARDGVRAPRLAARHRRVLGEGDDDAHAEDAEAQAHDEHRVVAAGYEREQSERQQRPEHRPGGVHRPVHPERDPQRLRARAERDERVARAGADALADPVDEHREREKRRDATGQQQADPRHGRQAVPRDRDGLVASRAVGDEPARDPDERRRTLVERVDDPEDERARAEREHDVQRQDGRDHLRGDVRQQARHAEDHDVASDAWPTLSAVAEPQQTSDGLDFVHGLAVRRGSLTPPAVAIGT